jgi:flagellar biosynthetic protein FlhB
MSEDQEKTEEPSHRRLEDAHKKGQVVTSREVSNFLILLALTANVVIVLPYTLREGSQAFIALLTDPDAFTGDFGSMQQLFWESLRTLSLLLVLPIGLAMAVGLAAGTLQHRPVLSSDPVKPKLERISPLKGFKRLFSMRSVMEFIKSLAKLVVVGVVAYTTCAPFIPQLELMPAQDITDILRFTGAAAAKMLIGICAIMFLIAMLDYLYQFFSFRKNLRMSRQELKEEFKQQEGDPHIKGKLRQIRMERARKRMMAEVPHADVVITNPTHYAVALQYDTKKMQAPKVVAKGLDRVALRIREIAEEHKVPIMENPPLARALHDSVELEDEIPIDHYQAVAEIISYVYRLKRKKV